MMPPAAPGVLVHTDMPASEYHADPCPTRSLSSTVARAMVIDGCARNGQGFDDSPSKAKDAGNILHHMILGSGDNNTAIIEHDSYRTKAAQDARDKARAAGKTPVKRADFDELGDVADALTERMDADPGLSLYHAPEENAYSELTILHQRKMQHGPIWIRTRLDHVKFYPGRGIEAYDLKTTGKRGNAHRRRASETIAREGYDIQAAAYVGALEAAWPKYAGRVSYVWVFAETCRPQNIGVHGCGPGGIFPDRGQRLWDAACEMWATGVHTGRWPGYHHYEQLPAPGWLEYQEAEYE